LRPSEAPRTLSSGPVLRLSQEGGRTSEIFISYRREDAPAHAGRLYDGLVDEFGAEQVFMDVDTLEPGVDFVERIHAAVGTADAFLVVIGRGWLNAKDPEGERRLDDPEDFVRLEVGLALSGDPIVIPVLVGGATMPAEEELPADLAQLARRNALTLVDADWRSGLGRLVAALQRIVEPVPEPGPLPEPEPRQRHEPRPAPPPDRIPALATALGVAGAVALVAGTGLQFDLWAHPSPPRGDTDGLGYFTSVAPMTVAVGALGSLLLSYQRNSARLATGLFLGFALAGVARYVSLLGAFSATPAEETTRVVAGVWLALLGCLLLAGAAAVRIGAQREEPDSAQNWLPRALVLSGAALVVVAAFVPFNVSEVGDRTLLDRGGGWSSLEALGPAALAVATSFFLGTRRAVASGALIALGVFLTGLWAARYVGFPALQSDDIAEVGLGGFIGLGGGLAILVGGLVARPSARTRRLSSERATPVALR
jgi:hypothetical protein